MSDSPSEQVRAYYRALDAGEYDRLHSLLHPEFVHERPDMTLSGRERFVTFMREERPLTDTTHPISDIYRTDSAQTRAAEGNLLDAEGTVITGFVDVFRFENGQIRTLQTYTDR